MSLNAILWCSVFDLLQDTCTAAFLLRLLGPEDLRRYSAADADIGNGASAAVLPLPVPVCGASFLGATVTVTVTRASVSSLSYWKWNPPTLTTATKTLRARSVDRHRHCLPPARSRWNTCSPLVSDPSPRLLVLSYRTLCASDEQVCSGTLQQNSERCAPRKTVHTETGREIQAFSTA